MGVYLSLRFYNATRILYASIYSLVSFPLSILIFPIQNTIQASTRSKKIVVISFSEPHFFPSFHESNPRAKDAEKKSILITPAITLLYTSPP